MFQSPAEAADGRYDTWGNSANTWTSGEPWAGRIDYLFYRTRAGASLMASTSMYGAVDEKTEGFSLSDHMGVEAAIEITFKSKGKSKGKCKGKINRKSKSNSRSKSRSKSKSKSKSKKCLMV